RTRGDRPGPGAAGPRPPRRAAAAWHRHRRVPDRLRARPLHRRILPAGGRAVRDARQSGRPRDRHRRHRPQHGSAPVAADAGGGPVAGAARPTGGVTPLARLLAARIAADGPIGLHDFMRECLLHPVHGYYTTRPPFGRAGDFVTAPEISQMFGEILGLCLAQAWLDQGRPAPFALAELGPGRGTLMADMLRAMRHVPGLTAAAE